MGKGKREFFCFLCDYHTESQTDRAKHCQNWRHVYRDYFLADCPDELKYLGKDKKLNILKFKLSKNN